MNATHAELEQPVIAVRVHAEAACISPCIVRQAAQAESGVVPFGPPSAHEPVQSEAQGETVAEPQPQLVSSAATKSWYPAALAVSHADWQAAASRPASDTEPPVPEDVDVEVEVEVEVVVVVVDVVPPVPVPVLLVELHARATSAAGTRSARSLIEERVMDESFRHAEE